MYKRTRYMNQSLTIHPEIITDGVAIHNVGLLFNNDSKLHDGNVIE